MKKCKYIHCNKHLVGVRAMSRSYLHCSTECRILHANLRKKLKSQRDKERMQSKKIAV